MDAKLKKLREETPACSRLIHLNNAGTSLSPTTVTDCVFDYLKLEQQLGGYEAELLKAPELTTQVYESLARLINCQANEIAITQNATRAWDMIFYSLPLSKGDKILTCRAEYASNFIAFLQRQKRDGFEIVVLDNDENGAVCPDSLKANLDDSVKLVAINHIPTNGGLVQPAEILGEILRDHQAFYLLDACQSIGQIPVDVQKIGCQALTATSRKYLRGPRGIGFLFIANQACHKLEPPFLDLHAATWTSAGEYSIKESAQRFETYELYLAGKLGLGAAADYALKVGVEWGWERLSKLAQKARVGLSSIPGVRVHDLGRDPGGIVSFTVEDLEPKEIRSALYRQETNVWTCTDKSARLDMEARHLSEVVRASFHYYNTQEECETFLVQIRELCLAKKVN